MARSRPKGIVAIRNLTEELELRERLRVLTCADAKNQQDLMACHDAIVLLAEMDQLLDRRRLGVLHHLEASDEEVDTSDAPEAR
jgi:hypothetical protein